MLQFSQHFIKCPDLCINGYLRLAGGNNINEGRVEVCSNGVWGTIYEEGWDSRDAKVVCKQLGLSQPYSSKQFHCPADL